MKDASFPKRYTHSLNMLRIGQYRGVNLAWNHSVETVEELRAWFVKCLQHKINRRGDVEGIGRKWEDSYQIDLERDRRDIQQIVSIRLRVYQLRTPELRKRFAHLLASHDD